MCFHHGNSDSRHPSQDEHTDTGNPFFTKPKLQDWASFEAMKDNTCISMNMIEACCVNLKELLGNVMISHAQCDYLVQFYSNAIRGAYFWVSKDLSHMWNLYDSKKLRLLSSSLNWLMCCVKAAEDLLQACGDESELKRIALVASIPLSNVDTYSKFDVLIRELSWALDVIQYASSSLDLIFERSEVGHRYVLKRIQETDVLVNARLVHDRTNLLSQLQSLHVSSISVVEKLNFPEDFVAVVKKRLLEIPGSHSLGSVPTCFHIVPLHLEKGRCILEGGYKKVYVGKWFGLKMAIAIIERTTRDIVESKAGFMVEVQHPNIVDFYGFAFEEMKKEEGKKDDNVEPPLPQPSESYEATAGFDGVPSW